MQRYRLFATLFIGILFALLAGNFAVWKFWTEDLLTGKYAGGDMARLGYYHRSKLPRQNSFDLPRRCLSAKEYHGQKIDIITIGDSFSQGGGGGRNSYYQDYIASFNNAAVLNIYPAYPTGDLIMVYNQLSTLSVLLNSGFLDQARPKAILIQSAERYSILRFSGNNTFDKTASLSEVMNFYGDKALSQEAPPTTMSFINDGNAKFVYFTLLHTLGITYPTAWVRRAELSQPLFSVPDATGLLYFTEDMRAIPRATPEGVASANDNLNRMARILAKKGIVLYFMLVADKSNIYRDFLQDARIPRSRFFEELRPLPKEYIFIDTKKILTEAVRRGEKDVYFPDDSHWSWKGAELIFDRVRFDRILSGVDDNGRGERR
jgi:SGNH hydrolase-like domain, acetyltransferase AlgX